MKQLFINGKFSDSGTGKSFAVVNPATEQPVDQVAEGDARDIDAAVGAARKALEGKWGSMGPGDRARLMLQSLTVPGWGEATLGRRRSALALGLIELGIWGSFTAFRIQERMRRETYERTARLFGGIDLGGRDEEYRRIVGLYISSEEYNRLVVRRDAANLYFGDPAAYEAYIAAHEIRGADAWAWASEADFLRYRAERQATQRATKHAQDALEPHRRLADRVDLLGHVFHGLIDAL